MRKPQRHVNAKTGEVYYRVRYRRLDRQHALTFYGSDAKAEAAEFARLLDAVGADRAVAYWNANLDKREFAMPLNEWWDKYLPGVTGITPGTRLTYERIYDRVWRPAIGHRPLDLIQREDIAAVVNDLSEVQDKSDKTVRNAYGVIASCFKAAVRDNIIPASPCTDIRMPRRTEHDATEMRFLTQDEWHTLVDYLPAGYVPLFTMLIGTGMRWGEAEALTVADIVLEPTPVVRITKAAKWNASKSTRDIGPTKTRKSRRTVTLPGEVVAAVRPLLTRPRRERLFLALKGGELRHSKVYEQWLDACLRSGLGEWVEVPGRRRKWDGPRIHDLRHSHASWLIAAGVPLPVIRDRLGHESIETTVNRYGHLMPDLQRAAADAADVAMRLRPSARPALEALPGGLDAGS